MISETSTNFSAINDKLRHVLEIHLDPRWGTPYWLARRKLLDFDIKKEIHGIQDLHRLGPMDPKVLQQRPIEEMIPRLVVANRRDRCIVAETGGTLGRSKFAVYQEHEFIQAFVDPFLVAARRIGFPKGHHWLYVGPSGPHIIGRAARYCARHQGDPEPFTIDFDPRWFRNLPLKSFLRKRYLDHVLNQSLQIFESQSIGILFSTPPILHQLSIHMRPRLKERIAGIHFGGMPVSMELRERLSESFPNAVLLSGYGNTLFGMAPELAFSYSDGIDYYPYSHRMVYRIIPFDNPDNTSDRLECTVPYGEQGQVLAHRFDETQFIPNMIERDSAIRIPPLPDDKEFYVDGLRNPNPIRSESIQPTEGLY